MRVLFVWPNRDVYGYLPIGISLLSAVLKREGHETALFDTTFIDTGWNNNTDVLTQRGIFRPVDMSAWDVEKKKVDPVAEFRACVDDWGPDVVAVSALSDEIDLGNKLTDSLPRGVVVYWGGKGVTMDPSRIRRGWRLLGEGANDFPSLLSSPYCIYDNFIGTPCENLDSLPLLDWSIFDARHFLKRYDGKVYRGGDYMISHGCPGSCSYCINEAYREMYPGLKSRRYSVNRATEELVYLKNEYRLEFLKFHDEDFLLKPAPYLRQLAVAYSEQVGLPFTCMTNAKSVTPSRVRLLKTMGCVSISMGIETGDVVMRQMLRRRESVEDIIRAADLIQGAGIRLSAFNMIGLPFETEETLLATIAVNQLACIRHPNVSFYVPLRGTKLYDLSVAYGFWHENSKVEAIDKPVLRNLRVSDALLQYYYDNFYNLVLEDL